MNPASTLPTPRPIAGEISPGHVLGRYELLLPIAAGGMAMVWAARVKGTRGFQKIVAVKTMLSMLSDDERFEHMFLAEAQLASQIRHPNVVEISDLGEQDGVLYLAMEWIDGVPLNVLMKTAKPAGGVPLPIAVRIVMNACAGLHAAHELRDAKGQLVGLVHRDVSPQNILVTYDGVSKVVDFGVAKATALGGGVTVSGQLKGKVSYMAPEQVRGEAIDRRVDVFAMGIVLYALTTGKHPFRRENEAATMYTIASDDPVVAPRKFQPDYPASLQAVLLKALAKSTSQRYATASELQRALDRCLPISERVNADEDVGLFISSLFGKQREQSRAALADALALADEQSPRAPAESVNPFPHSQINALSGGGSQPSAQSTERIAYPSVVAPDAALRERWRRMRWLLLGGAVLATGLAALAVHESAEDARLASQGAPAGGTAQKPPAPTPTPTPTPTPAAVASAQSIGLPPPLVDSAASRPRATPAASRVAATAPKLAPPRAVAPPAPSAKPPPPPPSWRQDPGF